MEGPYEYILCIEDDDDTTVIPCVDQQHVDAILQNVIEDPTVLRWRIYKYMGKQGGYKSPPAEWHN